MLKKTLIFGALALAGASLGWAGKISDPHMDVIQDSLSDPVSEGLHFTADATGGGLFGFFNDTGQLIIALTLNIKVRNNLEPEDVRLFTCGGADVYFLTCQVDYNKDFDPLFGLITYSFFGVNEPRGPQTGNAGDQEGIGLVDPDGCSFRDCPPDWDPNIGHFAINLNNPNPDLPNGWDQPGLFYNPDFVCPEQGECRPPANVDGFATLADVPEPGTVGLMISGIAVAAARIRRRRR